MNEVPRLAGGVEVGVGYNRTLFLRHFPGTWLAPPRKATTSIKTYFSRLLPEKKFVSEIFRMRYHWRYYNVTTVLTLVWYWTHFGLWNVIKHVFYDNRMADSCENFKVLIGYHKTTSAKLHYALSCTTNLMVGSQVDHQLHLLTFREKVCTMLPAV